MPSDGPCCGFWMARWRFEKIKSPNNASSVEISVRRPSQPLERSPIRKDVQEVFPARACASCRPRNRFPCGCVKNERDYAGIELFRLHRARGRRQVMLPRVGVRVFLTGMLSELVALAAPEAAAAGV
ncbi:hypothetical protein [Trinickia sp. YCB016]